MFHVMNTLVRMALRRQDEAARQRISAGVRLIRLGAPDQKAKLSKCRWSASNELRARSTIRCKAENSSAMKPFQSKTAFVLWALEGSVDLFTILTRNASRGRPMGNQSAPRPGM